MIDARRYAQATSRNREPIKDVLARVLPEAPRVLEIASGSGEHAVWLAEVLAVRSWQPSDPDPDCRASIDAWRAASAAGRVLPAIDVEATLLPWPIDRASIDVVVCINMLHIAPWRACQGLMAGAAAVLAPGGLLYLYGPYRRHGVHTAPTNEAFDASLRAKDPAWGLRDFETVTEEAAKNGLTLSEVVAMPANNLSVCLERS